MEDKKQSSIEWLTDKLFEEFGFAFSDNILQQAKEKHKQEMDIVAGDWWNEGASYMHDGKRKYESFEQYYNETFNPQSNG
jgi:hypothetical protein